MSLRILLLLSHINKLLKKQTQFIFSQVFVCSHNITLSVPACGYIPVLCAGHLKRRDIVFYLHFIKVWCTAKFHLIFKLLFVFYAIFFQSIFLHVTLVSGNKRLYVIEPLIHTFTPPLWRENHDAWAYFMWTTHVHGAAAYVNTYMRCLHDAEVSTCVVILSKMAAHQL